MFKSCSSFHRTIKVSKLFQYLASLFALLFISSTFCMTKIPFPFQTESKICKFMVKFRQHYISLMRKRSESSYGVWAMKWTSLNFKIITAFVCSWKWWFLLYKKVCLRLLLQWKCYKVTRFVKTDKNWLLSNLSVSKKVNRLKKKTFFLLFR